MAAMAMTQKFLARHTAGSCACSQCRVPMQRSAAVFPKAQMKRAQFKTSKAVSASLDIPTTAEEKAQVKQILDDAFSVIALRNEGVVSRSELVTALRNTFLAEATVVEMLSKMDEDRSGFVDPEEFQHFFFNDVLVERSHNWTLKDSFGLEKQRSYMKTLNKVFPGSDSQENFVASMTKTLASRDFNRDNAIQMISLCRDEITRDLVEELDSLWGQSFNISSLAGLVLCGCTSFGAAMSHAPELDSGREKYVFTVAPHVAIDDAGNVGLVKREGRSTVGNACGALIAYHKEISSGTLNLAQDPLDIEMSLLRQNLSSNINAHKMSAMSLTDVTHTCATVIQAQLEKIIEQVIPAGSPKDYAVVSGVQIHGPENRGFFWLQDMYEVTEGVRTDLKATYKSVAESRDSKLESVAWATDKLSVYGVSQKLELLKGAILAGDLNKVRLLMENHAGGKLSAKDQNGNTLLHLAAETGDLGMVIFFVSKFCALNNMNGEGKTPLDVATAAGHDELAKYMEAVGCRKTQKVQQTILV